jgi:hypothetical protein
MTDTRSEVARLKQAFQQQEHSKHLTQKKIDASHLQLEALGERVPKTTKRARVGMCPKCKHVAPTAAFKDWKLKQKTASAGK